MRRPTVGVTSNVPSLKLQLAICKLSNSGLIDD
jgi:hypothetical protein